MLIPNQKFWINVWVSLTFPVLGGNITDLSLGSFYLVYTKTKEFAFLLSLCNQINWSKKTSSAANKNTMRGDVLHSVAVVSVKSIFLTIDEFCVFLKLVLLSISVHKVIVFVWIRCFNSERLAKFYAKKQE